MHNIKQRDSFARNATITQHRGAALSVLLLWVLTQPAVAQSPLLTFVQASDSQPKDAQDLAMLVEVMDTIVEGGTPGALLPEPVDFVVFAGDLVDKNDEPSFVEWLQVVDPRLTANGIPIVAVPGNHDVDNGGPGLYEQYIGDSDVWSFDAALGSWPE